eukprot:Phypoly_transcript_08104.p1 GENE.Phypoly_transcript_08104~~Phypoly_transcript_08104.p1  ORF type:complete len:481 (+),score=74.05 Phypoly_transcript_08104:101-1444(+)
MNQCVVSMMQDSAKQSKVASQHNSEKALLGYTTYHHMLLALCAWFPEVQERVDHVLEQFLRHESARVKLAQPDLGELLVYLSVASRVTWQQIGQVFLQEQLDRSVVWMLDEKTGKGHGELAYLETSSVSDYRLKVSLESSITGKRLLMFQVLFLEKIGRPAGRTPAEVLKRLNASYGAPPPGSAALLQRESNKIYSVKTWDQFYARISLPCPSKKELTKMLRQSVINSEKKGYHVNRLSEEDLYKWRIKTDRSILKQDTEDFPDSAALKPGSRISKKSQSSQNEHAPSQNGESPQNGQTPQIPQIGQAPQDGQTSSPNSHSPQNTQMPPQISPIPSQNGHSPSVANGQSANSNHITNTQNGQQHKPVKIFVGNLSYRVTPLDLEFVFQQFGKLVSSQVIYDLNDKSRGFGFIEVENEDIATTLLDFMQGADVDRRPIRLERVMSRTR